MKADWDPYQPAPLSTTRPSDSNVQIQLHPLVLLTISDVITRNLVRQQAGKPVVGAIIGQQTGREITLEHAFEVKTVDGSQTGEVALDTEWFSERLEQYKDVHKAPALDLVATFALGPVEGPLRLHQSIHSYILGQYNDSALLVLFHPEAVSNGSMSGGKLPVKIYESVLEDAGERAGEGMEVEGKQAQAAGEMRFREVSYTVETAEAEMIAVDFVARGGGNATAVENEGTASKPQATEPRQDKGKGKQVVKEDDGEVLSNGVADGSSGLTPEEEEIISSLTARANAIKMLQQRIKLINAYLANLPPSYLTDASLLGSNPPSDINHRILRSILSLVSRLQLLIPSDTAAFTREAAEQKSDVALVDLLGSLTSNIRDAKEMGRKFGVVDKARWSAKKVNFDGMSQGGGGAMDIDNILNMGGSQGYRLG